MVVEAAGAVVHQGRDLDQIGAAAGVGQLGDAAGPGVFRLGEQRPDAESDPGVRDGGDVAGAGQVPGGDGRAEDFGGIQAR